MPHRVAVTLALVFAAVALLFSAPATTASAHANQVRSSPSPNQQLDASPGRVIVWFSEPIEGSFSRIQVLDSGGAQLDNGDSALDPTEPTAMSVSVPDLPNGTYTVAWRNLSTVDGHRVVGSFLFSVGEPVGAGASVDTAQPLLQTWADPWLRWAFFLGAMALFGGLLFELVVIGPAFADAGHGTRRHAAALAFGGVTARLAALAIGVAVAGHLGSFFQQAYVTSAGSLGISALRDVALESGWGRLWLWRSAALALSAVLVAVAARTRSRGDEDDDGHRLLTESMFGQAALVAAAGVLVVTSLSSHNAAAPAAVRTLATVTDLVHIIAAGTWVGGLAMLAVSLPVLRRAAADEFRPVISESIPRFSTLALLGAGTLAITGVFSGYMQVTTLAATQTPYGWTLVAKVALIAPLLGLAAYNGFRVARRLANDERAPGILRRVVLLEVATAALVLLAVGWLASLEPARQYAPRHGIGVQDAATHSATDSGTTMSISVEPAQVGANSIRVELADALGRPVTTATDVRVRVRSLEQDLGEQQFSLDDLGDGAWGVDDHQLNIAGAYQFDVTVTRSDAFDARASFRFDATGGAAAADAIRPDTDVAWTLFGIQVTLLGTLCLAVAAPWLGRRVATPRRALLGAGGVLAIGGLLVAVNVTTLRLGFAEELANPFPATAESVATGQEWYAHACAYCHGDTGRGDGPGREELDLQPADLVVHVPLHTDSVLFQFIRDGVPSRGMPGQEGHLTEEQMWHLVNFLRALAESDSS